MSPITIPPRAYVVPVGAFRAADVPPFVPGGYVTPCDRTGARVDADGARYGRVRFGARVAGFIAATPSRERNAVIVAVVAAQRRIGRTIAGRGTCDMIAYDVAVGPAGRDARTIMSSVAARRAAMRAPSTRYARARAAIRAARETRTADVPDAAPADADADASA